MLLTPFVAAAILLRRFYWPELVALAAIAGAFAIKDPLVIIARQYVVWKQEHPETRGAKREAVLLGALLFGCGTMLLVLAGNSLQWTPFILGAGAFTMLTVFVNVRNLQRSEWFQVASATALSATCLVTCLSAIGRIPQWCWLLWILSTLQATAGIFVVHARLDARIAARGTTVAPRHSRRAAFIAQAVLIIAAVIFVALGRFWVAAALILSVGCHLAELQRQRDPAELQTPLKTVGLRALMQSTAYTLVIIVGLW